MSDSSFKIMAAMYVVTDFIYPVAARRAGTFGIRAGMTVVDYGCGPGRYCAPFSRLVGPAGKVYAVDVQELAVEAAHEKARRRRLENVIPTLAHGYDSGLPAGCADMICALDMFFIVGDPTRFLAELRRIAKPDGVLILEDGHQPRAVTKAKVAASGLWRIVEETRDHLTCRPA